MVEACELARHFEAELCLLHVYSPMMGAYPEGHLPINESAHAEMTRYLDRSLEVVQQEAEKLCGRRVRRELVPGRDFEEIARFARQEGTDLIVVGTHGKGAFSRFFLGSVTERVLRKAPCRVLVVRPPNTSEKE